MSSPSTTFASIAVAAAILATTIASAQLCTLPTMADVSCGDHGHCVHNQRVGELVFEYDNVAPGKQLRQSVRIHEHASYCKCDPGYWGRQCESQCPSAIGRPCMDRHTQPLPAGSPDERCGQIYHHLSDGGAGGVIVAAPGNFSWALPGKCACGYPFLGDACQAQVDFMLIKPMPESWTPDFTNLLRFASAIRSDDRSSTHLDICGPGTAMDEHGCNCPEGIFPTHLRYDPALYAEMGVTTGTFPVRKKRNLMTTMAVPSALTPWIFSQTPLCAIAAKQLSPSSPAVPSPPTPPPETQSSNDDNLAKAQRELVTQLTAWKDNSTQAAACIQRLSRPEPAALAECTALAKQLGLDGIERVHHSIAQPLPLLDEYFSYEAHVNVSFVAGVVITVILFALCFAFSFDCGPWREKQRNERL